MQLCKNMTFFLINFLKDGDLIPFLNASIVNHEIFLSKTAEQLLPLVLYQPPNTQASSDTQASSNTQALALLDKVNYSSDLSSLQKDWGNFTKYLQSYIYLYNKQLNSYFTENNLKLDKKNTDLDQTLKKSLQEIHGHVALALTECKTSIEKFKKSEEAKISTQLQNIFQTSLQTKLGLLAKENNQSMLANIQLVKKFLTTSEGKFGQLASDNENSLSKIRKEYEEKIVKFVSTGNELLENNSKRSLEQLEKKLADVELALKQYYERWEVKVTDDLDIWGKEFDQLSQSEKQLQQKLAECDELIKQNVAFSEILKTKLEEVETQFSQFYVNNEAKVDKELQNLKNLYDKHLAVKLNDCDTLLASKLKEAEEFISTESANKFDAIQTQFNEFYLQINDKVLRELTEKDLLYQEKIRISENQLQEKLRISDLQLQEKLDSCDTQLGQKFNSIDERILLIENFYEERLKTIESQYGLSAKRPREGVLEPDIFFKKSIRKL